MNGTNKKSMIDKMDLFFADYSLMPLLVHENYLSVRPVNLKGSSKTHRDYDHLVKLYGSVEAMCNSDRIGRMIRTNNNWSLLPSQAIFATVVPGNLMLGLDKCSKMVWQPLKSSFLGSLKGLPNQFLFTLIGIF